MRNLFCGSWSATACSRLALYFASLNELLMRAVAWLERPISASISSSLRVSFFWYHELANHASDSYGPSATVNA